MGRDDDLDKELRFHIETRVDDLVAEGVAPDDARRQARLELGGVVQVREAVRDQRAWAWVDGMRQDLRLALRSLRATPVVTFVALLSLALGVGANTGMFSLVNSLLLRALPVSEPERLVVLRSREPEGFPEWSDPVWTEIRRHSQLFQDVAAWSPAARANVTLNGVSQTAETLLASGSFFETLGVRAFVGRTLSEQDDRLDRDSTRLAVVISYGFWQRQFGGASTAIGRTLTLEHVPFTIIGVTPPDFFGADVGRTFDIIEPLSAEALVNRSEDRTANAGVSWLNIIARLKPDQSLETATMAIRGVRSEILGATLPDRWSTKLLDEYRARPFSLVPAPTGDSSVREQYRQPLLTIMVVVMLVLLIACANIANLQLARAKARQRELGLRVALGASRGRLVRQLLTESAVLSAGGAALGLPIASWGSRLVLRSMSTDAQPVFLDVSIDRHVLLFTLVVAVTTVLLFGLTPAIQASTAAPMEPIRNVGNRISGKRRSGGAASGLVVAQVALCMVLVGAAGLFVRTFVSLETRPLGFAPEHVLVARVDAHSAAIVPSQRMPLLQRAREEMRNLPGVAGAALSTQTPPVVGPITIMPVDAISGGPSLPGMEPMSAVNFISAGWFKTLGTHIIGGRDVTDHDRSGSPRVALVNQAFARAFLSGASPVGHTISTTVHLPDRSLSLEIVGFVEDAVHSSLREAVGPMMYVPLAQADWLPSAWLAEIDLSVRSNGIPPMELARTVATTIQAVNPNLLVTSRSLRNQVNATLTQERVVALLSGCFGALALLLAGLGLYGVTAYAVSRRRTEIGVRVALGLTPGGIIRLVLARVTVLVGIGVIVGAVVSLWASTFVASLLYGLQPRDPATLVGAMAVLGTVGALAAAFPAYSALRINPADLLKES